MLKQLRITNFAILPEVTVTFTTGLNVLTGETGAGKSLLVDAIGLLAGARASADDVRAGQDTAVVEGIVEMPQDSPLWRLCKEAGVPLEGTEIILRRTVAADGRSRAFVNDWQWTVGGLTQLAPHWIDISGQHGQQQLMDEATHADWIDGFGGNQPVREEYASQFTQLRDLDQKIAEWERSRADAERQRDFLEHQFQELSSAKLKPGEDEELTTHHRRLAHGEKLMKAVQSLSEILDGDPGISTLFGRAAGEVRGALRMDETLQPWLTEIEDLAARNKDLSGRVFDYVRGLQFEPEEIQQIEDRLAVVQRLVRKYGSVDKALEEEKRIGALLATVEGGADALEDLRLEREKLGRDLLRVADRLTAKRQEASQRFQQRVTKELRALGMPQAKVEARFAPVPEEVAISIDSRKVGPMGAETLALWLAPNPGEGFKPLTRIASGGELSRVLLALKSVAWADTSSSSMTYLFDEVDAGIGGETAERVGQRLAALANGRQALCVTHLAQIACYGDSHMRVEKDVKGGRTLARVSVLGKRERTEELARMIGGLEVTRKALDHAGELLTRGTRTL